MFGVFGFRKRDLGASVLRVTSRTLRQAGNASRVAAEVC